MKYIKVQWPEIQDYMDKPDYPDESYFDPQKNSWFIPEEWKNYIPEYEDDEWVDGPSIGDLEDAMG